MRFEFATADRIVFGPGAARQLPAYIHNLGCRALVVTGASADRIAQLLQDIRNEGVSLHTFAVSGEPTIQTITDGLAEAIRFDCDLVAGVGGGSVIDAGKAIAGLLTNGGQPLDYLEGIGSGKPLSQRCAPYVAVPTTAGTGSEVTRNAVLGSPEHKVKVSMRSPMLLPHLALVDPELTSSLPPALTANTGLDALTQLLEAYVSAKGNPLTDGFCVEGLRRAARALPRVFEDGSDATAREDMSAAALLSGLALANAGLGAVHGFAGPVGGLLPAPHGSVCARLLPYVYEANVHALRTREPENPVLRRYDQVARILTENGESSAEDGLAWLQQLCGRLGVPPLATHGVTESDIPLLCARAAEASSMRGNPIELTHDELAGILQRAL